MKLSVNPNRMELMRLRRRLVLAERGHKLLKDKLEELMRRFLELMRQYFDLQSEVGNKLDKAFLSFALVRGKHAFEELEKYLPEGTLTLDIRDEKVFNLTIPRFSIENIEAAEYDLFNTDAELDIGLKKMKDVLKDMMELARLWKAIELLSQEIEATRRRVNALEHILIPSIKETVRYISSRLDEMERSYQVQLMRVKEIVRSH